MSQEFDVTVNLSTCNCSVCGIVYAVPCNYRETRRDDHKTFHCPNGHRQCFPDEPDESREEVLEEENQTLEYEKEKLEASLKYYKNKASKVKK